MKPISHSFSLACLLWALFSLTFTALIPKTAFAQNGAQSYTTITSIRVTALSNGVQIRISADGILQYRNADTNGPKMGISFPDARNGTGKNFFNVNQYPVSYISLTTPQDAKSGIGLEMSISNFVSTQASIAATADGQGVLLTIQSDRTIEKKARTGSGTAAPATGIAPDTSTQVRFQNGLLSLRAVRADIHPLLGAIAQKTGLNIAVDDSVDRKVSLNLQEVSPESAVRTIASAYGLALSDSHGIYMISEGVPTDLASYRLSGTQSYRMQNTQAQTASGLLPNFLYSYAKVNSEQNAVVVTAPTQMLAKIGADLNKVDIPSPQISIEAIAVELTDTKDLNVGLNLVDQRSTSISSVDTPTGTISYNTIGKLPNTFQATLHALEVSGRARVRARPKMAVVNGQTANIFIGAQRFILTQFNNFGQTQTRIQPVDVGVKLAVTPLTGGNGEITTQVAPEVSNITELDLQSGLPVLSTRRADTTVRVKDGETIAIGGLTLDQELSAYRKVPLLGDIPVIGKLFRSHNKTIVQTELVIFITPHILPALGSAPAAADSIPTAPASSLPAPVPETPGINSGSGKNP